MKFNNAILTVAISAISSVGFAYPGAGAGGYLDLAARDLTASAANLAYAMSFNAPNSDIYNDAVTLQMAAEHFQEEVELGPEDLPVDFNAIEQTINELQAHFTGCNEYRIYPQVRDAWFRVEESNIRLRQAWLGGGQGGGDGRGGDGRGGDGRGGDGRGGDGRGGDGRGGDGRGGDGRGGDGRGGDGRGGDGRGGDGRGGDGRGGDGRGWGGGR